MNELDPIERLVRIRALREVRDAHDVEVQLNSKVRGGRPLLVLLMRAREGAVSALAALASVDPENPSDIRALQNQVQIFGDLVTMVREIVRDGEAADQDIQERDREEMIEFLNDDPEGIELAKQMGMIEEGRNDNG